VNWWVGELVNWLVNWGIGEFTNQFTNPPNLQFTDYGWARRPESDPVRRSESDPV
jgi:hypothetical protein